MSSPHFTTADKKVFRGYTGFSRTIGKFVVINTCDSKGEVKVWYKKKFTNKNGNHAERCFYLDLVAQINEIPYKQCFSQEFIFAIWYLS